MIPFALILAFFVGFFGGVVCKRKLCFQTLKETWKQSNLEQRELFKSENNQDALQHAKKMISLRGQIVMQTLLPALTIVSLFVIASAVSVYCLRLSEQTQLIIINVVASLGVYAGYRWGA